MEKIGLSNYTFMTPRIMTLNSFDKSTQGQLTSKDYGLGFKLLLALVAFEYVRPHDLIPLIQPLHIGMVLQIGLFFYLIVNLPFKLPKMGYAVFAFILMMLLGIPFAYLRSSALGITQYMLKMFVALFLPIMIFVNDLDKLKKFITWFIFINVIVAITAVFNSGMGAGHFLADENDLSLTLNIILPFVYFSILRCNTSTRKTFYAISFFIILAAIVVSKSRGGFLGLIAVLFYCYLYSPHKKVFVQIFLALCVLAFLLVPSSYWKEMETLKEGTEEKTADERIYSWKLACKMFLDDPFFGVGPANYSYKVYVYQGDELSEGRRHMWGRVAHSLYFTIIPEYGIAGIILFLYLLRLFYINNRSTFTLQSNISKRLHDDESHNSQYQNELFFYYISLSLNGGMIGFLVSGAFISVLYYPHFWILLSLSSSLNLVANNEMSPRPVDNLFELES